MFAKIRKINILLFIYYNWFSKKIERDKGCYLIPMKGAVIDLAAGAQLVLHGSLFLNYNKPRRSHTECWVIMRTGATLIIHSKTYLSYGSTIEIHKDALIEIGGAYINTGAVLLAAENIKIGKGVLISREVYIYDSDHHAILDEEGQQTNFSKPVLIGDHVWIGIKSTILRGSKIGDGAVISAGSTVVGKIRASTMAIGFPARSFSNVNWKE